jgi:hypothetical protein
MGARGRLPEPNILMKVGQDTYTPAIFYNKLIEKYTRDEVLFNWS